MSGTTPEQIPSAYGLKRAWSILSLITANGLWIGFPLYNRAIVLRHFHRKGWEQN
ncbi:hypothetical protein [Phaeobacter gallaeciensis]|uniref:hypothetical protein n=1 Tax=Phaeobacter gallaeciensis TaxID=60890 RepID=UPI0015F0D788|nr:hypothetical protein [Phaeobacter gallaeciensis]